MKKIKFGIWSIFFLLTIFPFYLSILFEFIPIEKKASWFNYLGIYLFFGFLPIEITFFFINHFFNSHKQENRLIGNLGLIHILVWILILLYIYVTGGSV